MFFAMSTPIGKISPTLWYTNVSVLYLKGRIVVGMFSCASAGGTNNGTFVHIAPVVRTWLYFVCGGLECQVLRT